jgi:hypothetical protein
MLSQDDCFFVYAQEKSATMLQLKRDLLADVSRRNRRVAHDRKDPGVFPLPLLKNSERAGWRL